MFEEIKIKKNIESNEDFASELETNKHWSQIKYLASENSPGPSRIRIDNIKFENCVFPKCVFHEVTFKDCVFNGCVFIGAKFINVEMHGCEFINCNFHKAKFEGLYARPSQFYKAITDKKYANVAVHLFHQLRSNYARESQSEYQNGAEYMFAKWDSINSYLSNKEKQPISASFTYALKVLYCLFFGYGYKVANLTVTAILLVFVSAFCDFSFADRLYEAQQDRDFVNSIYRCLQIMTTLSAPDSSSPTTWGKIYIMINVFVGISLLAATLNGILKKVVH